MNVLTDVCTAHCLQGSQSMGGVGEPISSPAFPNKRPPRDPSGGEARAGSSLQACKGKMVRLGLQVTAPRCPVTGSFPRVN
jgi:hypothetical protein